MNTNLESIGKKLVFLVSGPGLLAVPE